MNTDPNSEANFISYKNSDETFDSTFEGTIKDDLTPDAEYAPNTFINEDQFSLVDINYKELGITSSNYFCASAHPASRAIDDNLINFSHTNQICGTANQFFHFTETIYLSNVEIYARGGADRRLRKINFLTYANDGVTKNFDLYSDTQEYLSDQQISFNLGTEGIDYQNLHLANKAEFNLIDGYSGIYKNNLLFEGNKLAHRKIIQLIDTNKIEIKRIADGYYYDGQGYTAPQQEDDKKVLQMAELKAYGLDATEYDLLQEDCENGTRDYFETSIDCGGNFCPTLGLQDVALRVNIVKKIEIV